MKRIFIVIIALIGLFPPSIVLAGFFDEVADTPVSAIELLTVGEKYDGWRVKVQGFLLFTKDRSLLYLGREAYETRDEASSMYLDLNGAQLDLVRALKDASGKYVAISGVFKNEKRTKNAGDEMTFGPPYKGRIESIKNMTVLQR